jgi:dihydrofolate reductase
MRKVMLGMQITLDGFLAGPNNEMDWMTPTDEEQREIAALMENVGAALMGYGAYKDMSSYWPHVPQSPSASEGEREVARVMNKAHKLVLSNTDEELAWENSELLLVKNDDDIVGAVTRLKQQAGKDLGLGGGAGIAQTFARLGLVDEYRLMVHPVAIGKGKALFTDRTNLELVSVKSYKSGVMQVIYRPR